MKRPVAALLASTAIALQPAYGQTVADSAKAAIGTSSLGLYAFSSQTGLGYLDGLSAKPKLVPMVQAELPAFGGTGSDVACASAQTSVSVLCSVDALTSKTVLPLDRASPMTADLTLFANSNPGPLVAPKAQYARASGAGYTNILSCFDSLIFATTTTAATSTTSISVTSATNLAAGQAITGVGVPAGTTVSSISGTTITASEAVNIASGASLTFTDSTGPARINDYLARSLLYDDTSIINACVSNLPSGYPVLWPAGSTLSSGLVAQQSWFGLAAASNTGTQIFANNDKPAITGYTIEGFSLISLRTPVPGAFGIYIKNAQSYRVRRNFFQGFYAQVYMDGSSGAGDLEDNFFYAGATYQLLVNSTTQSGVDLHARGNHLEACVANQQGSIAPTVSSVKFTGLGSLVWANNQITVCATSGPLVDFDTPAPQYGGTQITTSVFEESNPGQTALYLHGTSSTPWGLWSETGSLFTGVGGGGSGVQIVYANHPIFSGGAITNAGKGALLFSQYGTIVDAQFYGVDFETDGSVPIISSGRNVVGASFFGPSWTGSASMIDFTAIPSGGQATQVNKLEVFGGNCGTAALPFLLPIGSVARIIACGINTTTLDATSVTAAGTSLATATALTAPFNEIMTVASGTGVSLPAYNSNYADTLQATEIVNAGANTLAVYPFSTSVSIWVNGTTYAAGASVPLSTGAHARFTCPSATLCRELP